MPTEYLAREAGEEQSPGTKCMTSGALYGVETIK